MKTVKTISPGHHTHIHTMPKASKGNSAAQQRRHNPLSEEYAPSELKQKTNKKRKSEDVTNKEEGFVNSKASRNILQLGQDLAAEDEAEQEANRPAQPNLLEQSLHSK